MGIEKTISLFLVLAIGMIFALATMLFEYVGHQDEIETKNDNIEDDGVDLTKTNLESRIKDVQDILASKKDLDFKTLNDLEEAINSFLQ